MGIPRNKKYKTVVDTNSVNNSGLGNKIFGRRDILEELRDRIDLYVPEIVISEIKAHKYKNFNESRQALLRNELLKYADFSVESIESFDAQLEIENDIVSEDYPYTIIQIDDYKAFFDRFIPLAIRRKPPFQTDSDKGIQDALIAASVEKLLGEIGDKEDVILVSNDARLREYFEKNERVRTVADLKGVFDELDHDNGEVMQNSKEVKLSFSGLRDKEPKRIVIDKMLTDFRNSINFRQTHERVALLKKNQKLLEKKDKKDIIESALNNSQIRWVVKDQDIYDFLMPVYLDCVDILDDKTKTEFETIAGINNSPDDDEIAEIPF